MLKSLCLCFIFVVLYLLLFHNFLNKPGFIDLKQEFVVKLGFVSWNKGFVSKFVIVYYLHPSQQLVCLNKEADSN